MTSPKVCVCDKRAFCPCLIASTSLAVKCIFKISFFLFFFFFACDLLLLVSYRIIHKLCVQFLFGRYFVFIFLWIQSFVHPVTTGSTLQCCLNVRQTMDESFLAKERENYRESEELVSVRVQHKPVLNAIFIKTSIYKTMTLVKHAQF